MKIFGLQALRRGVQWSVVIAILAVPAVARYQNYLAARELDHHIEDWHGTAPGYLLAAIDRAMRLLPGAEVERAGRVERNRTAVLSYAQGLRGSVWSAEVGPVSLTDPLAAAESVAASKRVPRVLLIGLAVPVLVTLLFGRVFCSWLCPVGLMLELTDKLRRVLRFLELPPKNVRMARATKYALLGAGIVLSAALSIPVLGYVYPPAILSRELHGVVFTVFDRAELGRQIHWSAGLTWMSLLLLGIVLFEMTISKRWWCRYVCPGGALYSLIGALRPVRVKLDQAACTDCALCTAACPMGLNPMKNQMGPECDNCGVCITACKEGALGYGLRLPRLRRPSEKRVPRPLVARSLFWPLAIAGALVLGWTGLASAHHILGIPHYAYEEDYPQAPVLTYRVNAGPYEVKMTGYPGMPSPGEPCALHVYIRDRRVDRPYDGEVTLTVLRDRLIGEDPIVYGPVSARLDERIYKFYPRFDREANYTVRIAFSGDTGPWTLDLPMVVGEPGSPWVVLGAVAFGVLCFLLVIRAVRIKLKRRGIVQPARRSRPVPEGA